MFIESLRIRGRGTRERSPDGGEVRTWVKESTTIVRYCTSLRRSRCALLFGPAYPNTSSTFLHALARAVVGCDCA